MRHSILSWSWWSGHLDVSGWLEVPRVPRAFEGRFDPGVWDQTGRHSQLRIVTVAPGVERDLSGQRRRRNLVFCCGKDQNRIGTLVSLIKVMLKIRVMTTKWSNYFDRYDYNKGYGKILPNRLTSFWRNLTLFMNDFDVSHKKANSTELYSRQWSILYCIVAKFIDVLTAFWVMTFSSQINKVRYVYNKDVMTYF